MFRMSISVIPVFYRLSAVLLTASALATAQERRLLTPIVTDARTAASEWRFTVDAPAEGWQDAAFDDQAWLAGYGGFGSGEVTGAKFGTEWVTPEIWLRKVFEYTPGRFEELVLGIHHDDDVEVYLNGVPILTEGSFTSDYTEAVLPVEALAALKEGLNILAVHCANTGSGPQYLDVGLSGSRTVNVTVLSADARLQTQDWKYTLTDPGVDWESPDFLDEGWTTGPGGFGSRDLYSPTVGTDWTDTDIWMRRTFSADREFPEYLLTFHHDDGLEVYLNGNLVLQRDGFTAGYQELTLTAAAAGVKNGVNTLAVHCANSGAGPQFVDVGLLGMAGGAPTGLKGKRARLAASLSTTRGAGFYRYRWGIGQVRLDGRSVPLR